MAASLEGRVALVTGASKNIGKGMALEVGASGAVTYLTARTLSDGVDPLGSLERTAAEIEAAGGRAIPVACDHTGRRAGRSGVRPHRQGARPT